MYTRQKGDNLLSNDKRLKYNWKWKRVASDIDEEEIKRWTHFQTSYCKIGDWELHATQWGIGDNVNYEAEIQYVGNHINSQEGFKTRLDAQIGAEKLLHKWIETEYKTIKG